VLCDRACSVERGQRGLAQAHKVPPPRVRENDGRHLGFRFFNVFSTSGLFFVGKRPVFRFEGPGAPRGEKKAKKNYTRDTGGARPSPSLPPARPAPPRPESHGRTGFMPLG
jgi:hypothetical protein